MTGVVKTESVGGSDNGTIEFAMLNACETERWARSCEQLALVMSCASGVRMRKCLRAMAAA